MHPLLEITEGSIALLEKAAQEADALEVRCHQLETQLVALKKQAVAKPEPRTFSPGLLEKLAETLDEESLLVEGVTPEKLAGMIQEKPDHLAHITLRLLRPVLPEGRSVKSATALQSPGSPKVVTFEGRQLLSYDGFEKVLA